MRRTLAVLLVVGLLGCASLRQPSSFTGFLPDAGAVEEATPKAMGVVESMGYRIESVETDAGHLVGVQENALSYIRVTVTLREDDKFEGLRLRVAGQAGSGPDAAERAARQVRDRLQEAFGVE